MSQPRGFGTKSTTLCLEPGTLPFNTEVYLFKKTSSQSLAWDHKFLPCWMGVDVRFSSGMMGGKTLWDPMYEEGPSLGQWADKHLAFLQPKPEPA